MHIKWIDAYMSFHISLSAKSPQNSTYQRMSLQLNESYGLQQWDLSLPVMPLPDLTTLPHEPIHQLTGKHAQCPLSSPSSCKYRIMWLNKFIYKL